MKLILSYQIADLKNTRTFQLLQSKLTSKYPITLINIIMIYET